MADKLEKFLSHSFGGWKSQTRLLVWLGIGESTLAGRRLSTSCSILTQCKKSKRASGVSFIRTRIPSMRVPLSWPNDLPKAPPPSIITLGMRTLICQFWETRNILVHNTECQNWKLNFSLVVKAYFLFITSETQNSESYHSFNDYVPS